MDITPTQEQCLNCNEPLHGEYCHKCGQHHRIYVRSIFAVLGDLMGEIGHWDSRFYRTLRGLFLRPGFLSLEFMRGRHASYVPPLRLYFFTSLIAFVIFATVIDYEFTKVPKEGNESAVILPEDFRLDLPFLPEEEQNAIKGRLQFFAENPDIFVQRIIQLTPQMMLLMLPFWALFLKVIYLFRKHYYLEHLTVALHTHSFILLSLLIVVLSTFLFDGITQLTGLLFFSQLGGWIDYGLFTWIVIYLLLTQKRFYQQGWPTTLFKFLLSGFAYIMLLQFAFVSMLIYSIVTA